MNVERLSKNLDLLEFRSATHGEALSHLSDCIVTIVAAVETERRQLTWSERNLLASALNAMERGNWLLARAYIWNTIQLDGQGRRVFGDKHRARLSKLTQQCLLNALRYLCRWQKLPETFQACSPPHVPHAQA
jgi:hypothetical protein